MKRKWLVAAIGAALVSGAAWAQWGPGMMGGYGPGPGMMGGGYGGGQAGAGCPYAGGGYGPGMMGGYGPGMMGGYGRGGGYGPGMMGGYGGGPGMMGGYGWGYEQLNLTDAQREKIASITGDMRTKQWGLMQSMHELRWNSFPAAKSDADLTKAYDAMAAIRKEMFQNRLDTRKKIDEVLTKEQREELGKYQRRGGW